jgi:hypothetical protein
MNTIRIDARRLLALAAVIGAGTAVPGMGAAQQVDPGATRVQMSDVTGPNVSSLLLFETGTIKTFACPVAWGVRTTAEKLAADLRAGALEATTASGVRRSPRLGAQRQVLEVLMDGENGDDAAGALVAALADPRHEQDDARNAASDLVRELEGLIADAVAMDPRKPGHETATELAAAVYEFNHFIEASDPSFLAAPPDEFLAIETVLSRLVIAGMENEGRAVDAASRRGDYGLPCAPTPIVALPAPSPVPPPTRPPARPAPVERAIEVCVLEHGTMRYVPAILRPATGDTLALRDGERIPFASVHPDVGYAGDLEWVRKGEPITIGRDTFLPYGRPFVLAPDDEVAIAGEFRGTALFVRKTARGRPELLLPLAPRCVVQPYQLMEDVRKIR